ncbi:MAG TPA: hypothetical protein VJV96_06760 [Candidatus Angelobacter sp.]|nr:hypothetical protein [Candidatus Angelobacter sp.]
MAIKKANTLHPPQSLNPQPAAGSMPVKTHVYRSITRLNAGFEKVILEFGNLKQINYFSSEPLTAMYNQLLRIRAQANREFSAVLSAREAANAAHFEGLPQDNKSEPLAE